MGELCFDGLCKGGGPKCVDNDQNPCTDVLCIAGNCEAANTNGLACDDGKLCTGGDQCKNSKCTGATLDCNDGNPCTDDSCNPNKGCVQLNNSKACSDNDASTQGDVCKDGTCVPGALIDCDDGNPCTDDKLDKLKGCVHPPNPAPCSDNNVCTLADTCVAGKCVSGPTKNCDDEEFCTFDYCHPVTGCEATVVADGNSCPGFPNSVCVSGKCSCQAGCNGSTCAGDGCGGQCDCAPGSSCVSGVCSVAGCGDCPAIAFCVNNQCVVPDYNGEWKVTANPSTKLVCGLANATYLPLTLTLTVVGNIATATASVAGFNLSYVGTVAGKHLKVVAQYTESGFLGDIEHTSVIEVDFDSPTTFDGTDSDSFVYPFLGPCSVIWVIHGQKL
jgi:hypothetical protein